VILQGAGISIDYFDILLLTTREERAMVRPIPHRTADPAAQGMRLAGPLERRIEELARQERAAIARGDWTTATSRALERVALREAHHRAGTRRRA
jgi:hypothetical protein